MTLGVIGGTGFIGGNFLKDYLDKFDEIKVLTRSEPTLFINKLKYIVGTLSDQDAIHTLTKNCDAILHAGFDHSYQYNITGIHYLISGMKKNNVPKLVYLSSFVVYNLFEKSGVCNEFTRKSRIYDIYSLEKLKIEEILNTESRDIQTIILQPSIVYGIGGNWSKTIISELGSTDLKLPHGGEGFAPIIYIKDLCNAIMLCLKLPEGQNASMFERFILSNDESINWKEFYLAHAPFQKNPPSTFKMGSNNKFSEQTLLNTIISFAYSKVGSIFFLPLFKYLKRSIELNENKSTGKISNVNLTGLSRALTLGTSRPDVSKAARVLNFKAAYGLQEGVTDMKKQIEEGNKK